ncbi:MAG: hydrogenase nickel incorporation protein HypB, partial [Anaerohalosphaeraceae bacterium]
LEVVASRVSVVARIAQQLIEVLAVRVDEVMRFCLLLDWRCLKITIGVIEGDIKTDTDAQKIRDAGGEAVQIETQGACHLSAEQVHRALKELNAKELDVVIIENVGNLVCPAAFDLGEAQRVILLSVPEGDDKPIKYPGTFAEADVVLINKIDLADYIDFNLERALGDIRVVNPDVEIFQVSATTGEGMDQWYNWLLDKNKHDKG